MNITEETLGAWAKGPAATEQERCDNAVTAIKKAIAASTELSKLQITVFPQGSYANRTNVRQDSDVDVCVRCSTSFFARYPEGKEDKDFGLTDGSLKYADYKDLVGKALTDYFGAPAVKRGKKAFDVHANTYRVDADVVPTFEYRYYTGKKRPDGTDHYHEGVAFNPDTGGRIINWPQQTYDNGVMRHSETTRRYKKVIRILKRLRNKMQDENVADANDVASFLIECLVWNAPLEAFSKDRYTDVLRHVLADVWNNTRTDEQCKDWGEVNEHKYLFRPSQPWTRDKANRFFQAAWDYMGYQ